jgi:hypothetical protein
MSHNVPVVNDVLCSLVAYWRRIVTDLLNAGFSATLVARMEAGGFIIF